MARKKAAGEASLIYKDEEHYDALLRLIELSLGFEGPAS